MFNKSIVIQFACIMQSKFQITAGIRLLVPA